MSIIEKKEKNLNQLISKLNSLTLTYSQPTHDVEKIKSLKLEVKKRLELEDNFNQEIEELSQETENLVSEIEKWQM